MNAVIDDRYLDAALWHSCCKRCKYFKRGFTCKAYPNGIPFDYLNGDKDHTTIDNDQESEIVYSPKK